MSEDVARECERLFMAAAPFVQAEQEAQEAFASAAATLRKARKAAEAARAAWVDCILTHDHRETCLPKRVQAPATRERGDEP